MNNTLTTVLIPLRVDSVERLENLLCVIKYLIKLDLYIFIYEADYNNNGIVSKLLPRTKKILYKFIYDDDVIFHRTKYINQMMRDSSTPYVAVWDSDIIVPRQQVEECINALQRGYDAAYPYKSICFSVSRELRACYMKIHNLKVLQHNASYMNPLYGENFVGGAFFVNKKAYESIGGENESFYGWGPEDGDRFIRWKVMQFKIFRSEGYAYHLWHPRDINGAIRSKTQQVICQHLTIMDEFSSSDDLRVIKN
ncbi:MAG: hypothetical protein K5874_05970 [Bacteroidaceae bacterium]|nr:hypothetical protein [Bacteroidaceae bacterium]